MRDVTKKSVTAAVGILTLTSSVMGSGVGLAFADSGDDDGHDGHSPIRGDDDGEDACEIEDIGHRFEAEVNADPAVAQAWATYNAAVQALKRAERSVARSHGLALQKSSAAARKAKVKIRKESAARKKAQVAVKAAALALHAAREAAIARIGARECAPPTPTPTPPPVVVTPTPTPTPPPVVVTPTPTPTPPPVVVTPTPTPTPPPVVVTPTPTPTPTPALVNGTFLGSAVRNPYGVVQVQIVVVNSRITTVTAPQYPKSSDSGQINARAIPILIQETLVAQSANIAAVSGASFTSPSFKTSLQSALTQAGL